MARRQTILICLMWLLVVSSITLCANATAAGRLATAEQVFHPQAGIYSHSFCLLCHFEYNSSMHIFLVHDILQAVAAAFSLGNRSCFDVGKYVVVMIVAFRTDAHQFLH